MREDLRHIRLHAVRLSALFALAALFACLGIAGTGAGGGSTAPSNSARRSNLPVWAAGDFNGDHKLEFVALGTQSHQPELQATPGVFRLPGAAVFLGGNRFRVRDLDGDSDRDI